MSDRFISDMQDGERGYIVPWHIATDKEGNTFLWSAEYHHFHEDAYGTADVTLWKEDGKYYADISRTNYIWEYYYKPGNNCIPVIVTGGKITVNE